MSNSNSSARRQQALDLLLAEKISSTQYSELLKEIEAAEQDTLTAESPSPAENRYESFTGHKTGYQLVQVPQVRDGKRPSCYEERKIQSKLFRY